MGAMGFAPLNPSYTQRRPVGWVERSETHQVYSPFSAASVEQVGRPASNPWHSPPGRGTVRDSQFAFGRNADAVIRRRAAPFADPQGLARRNAGSSARAGPADHRPAPSSVGPAGQPLPVP